MDSLMKTIFSFSKIGSFRLTVIALLTTVALGYGYNSYFKDYKELVSLHEGISTCSHRVNQSFTAKMIGDKNSVYLQNDFLNLTEDCFADTIAQFNIGLANRMNLVGNQINQLATETHALHEKILVASTTTQDLGKIYEKIESGRNIVIDEIDNSGLKNQGSQNLMLISLIAAFMIMSMIVLKSLWDSLTQHNSNMALENLAKDQLISQEDDRITRMDEILNQTLTQNGLTFNAQMFQSFRNYWQDKVAVAQVNTTSNAFNLNKPKARADEIVASEVVRAPVVETVTMIQNPQATVPSVNLTETISKVINLLSGKAFSNGVILDFDLSQTIYVKGNEDSISQVIFNLISHGINNNLSAQGTKVIRSELRVNADRVTLRLTDNSQVYTDELVRELNSQMNLVQDINLSLAKEFIAESKGELHVKNVQNAEGQSNSSVTELTLNVAHTVIAEASPRLVSYEKMKKKDFKKKNRHNRFNQNRHEQSV